MQSLNPFLAAFFRSPVAAQCTPVHHHILLVPLTDVLLSSHDAETGVPASEAVQSEEFLGSHVLRIAGPGVSAGGKDGAVQNLRDVRGKARQYSTLNGRSVIIKDSFIYSNKGFKTLAQAQILNDAIWYPDVFDPRQWLLYFISKPLMGTWEENKLMLSITSNGSAKQHNGIQKGQSTGTPASNAELNKKNISNFHDVLNQFPLIAKQMQPGLEKLFTEFASILKKPTADLQPEIQRTPSAKRVRRRSSSARENGTASTALEITEDFYAEDEEDVYRTSLETSVTAAIDLFQAVDKQQLSLLGATTELTGPVVENMIERYVTENIHHLLFPKIVALKRPEDLELEAIIRQMEYIDISQLGIAIEGGPKAKHDLMIQLGPAIEEFKKISNATGPQEMLEILLGTTKSASQLTSSSRTQDQGNEAANEKPIMTVNADTLVSLLLHIVIRSQVRNLQARLTYIRNFIFIDDVDNGELGYVLSTFEAVLTYLSLDSSGLRRASRKNKSFWEAVKAGDMNELRNIMEPHAHVAEDDEGDTRVDSAPGQHNPFLRSLPNGNQPRRSSVAHSLSEGFSRGSGLHHVFPFQSAEFPNEQVDMSSLRRIKKVAMDTRSLSSGSEISFHSRTASIGSLGSALEGDISAERIAQTCDAFGESVLMMAVQHGQKEALQYLLSLSEHYPLQTILDDLNNEDTTLLSAAIQLGHMDLIDKLMKHIVSIASQEQLSRYLSEQDIWGRSVGHYLFNVPALITRISTSIPWRQRDKNGQTPLFALCRSYDHGNYYDMVEAGLDAARASQGDGLPLHIDEHVDAKGNTLLHIINDAKLAVRILHYCDVDVNATNEKRFTALMVASKYGRYDMVRSLFADPRVDLSAKEARGLTAVELAKDDDVRNKIDDLSLFSMTPGRDSRITGVVRAFLVEDGSIRLVLKSAAPTDRDSFTVTTSRRTLSDFEQLAVLLAEENPASWIPTMTDIRSPFQLPSKPSRAILRDIQARTDWFLRIMLGHPTFATHEMLWEFFLVPELQLETMTQRTKLKAETRIEKVKEEYEPVEDVREVEQFVNHAREMVRSVSYSTKSVARRANNAHVAVSDLYDSWVLLHRTLAGLNFVPDAHLRAMEGYARATTPLQSSPLTGLHTTLTAVQSTVQALLLALSRPTSLIGQIHTAKREAERNDSSVSRSSRWPLGLLDDTRQRMQEEKERRARECRAEADFLSRELRYTQQTVASELAGWQEMHEKMTKRALRDFAKTTLVQERMKLAEMMRALRRVKSVKPTEEPEMG